MDENRRVERWVADLWLDSAMLKESWAMTAARRRAALTLCPRASAGAGAAAEPRVCNIRR